MSLQEVFDWLNGIWSWHPVVVGVFILGVDFGVIVTLRIFVDRKPALSGWWSFKVGDTLGLPVFAVGAAVILQDQGPSDGFYTQTWWYLTVLVVGYTVSLAINANDIRSGTYPWREQFVPNKFYHTLVYGVMFYWVVTASIRVIQSPQPIWAFALAIFGLAIWGAMFGLDTVKGAPEPGRR